MNSTMSERYKKIDCDEAEVLRQLGVRVYATAVPNEGVRGIVHWDINHPCNSAYYKWDWYVKLGEDDGA